MPVTDGKKIRALREVAGITQSQLANIGEVSQATVRRAENGLNVTIISLRAIANALSLALGYEVTATTITFDHSYLDDKTTDISSITPPKKLREILAKRGITQKEVSYDTRISRRHLSAVLSGKRNLSPKFAARILEFLKEYPRDAPDHRAAHVTYTSGALVNDSIAQQENLKNTANTIPDQNPLVRFGVSTDAKLELLPTFAEENDYDTIETLRAELLAPVGPITKLKDKYSQHPNRPQAGLFGPLTTNYDRELEKNPREINYAVLFARGARLYAARRTAEKQVISGEWPELDADEADAIDAICDLHGPLVMASAAGRKLVEDAHQYEATPEVYEKDRQLIEEFGQMIAAETDVIEPNSAEAFADITSIVPDDPQMARSRGLGLAATGSALTVIVGGAAWYGAGGAAATLFVPAAALGAAGLVGGFFWETIKKMDRFKRATDGLSRHADTAIDKVEKHASQKERVLLERMAKLVESKRSLFERVANLRPEFGWAKKYVSQRPLELSKEPVELSQLIKSTWGNIRKTNPQSTIEFSTSVLNHDAIVRGNRERLGTIFQALIMSAVQHGGPQNPTKINLASIDFSSNRKGASHMVRIQTDGPGLSEVELEHMLDQGFSTPRSSAPVSGYGLPIVKQIIKQHGGAITLGSERGKGLNITVSFPAYET